MLRAKNVNYVPNILTMSKPQLFRQTAFLTQFGNLTVNFNPLL